MQKIVDFFEKIGNCNQLRKQYFRQSRKDIMEYNFNTMKATSIMALFVLIIMLFVSEYMFPAFEVTAAYQAFFIVLAVFVVFFLFYQRVKKKDFLFVQIMTALFCLVICLFCGAIDIFPYPDSPASFFPIVIIAVQVLFIIPFSVSYSMLLVLEAVYIFLSYQFKTPRMAQNDIFNSVAAVLVAFVVSWIVMQLRVHDNHEKKTYQRMSSIDELTGVLNKVSCEKNISDYLEGKQAADGCALMILDIDKFKDVNDKLGHQVGDSVLQYTGIVLSKTFRSSDIVGRIGGDEFMILLHGVRDEKTVIDRCEQLQKEMFQYMRQNMIADITFSIGTVMMYDVKPSFDKAYKMADDALYEAKSSGKARNVIQIMKK